MNRNGPGTTSSIRPFSSTKIPQKHRLAAAANIYLDVVTLSQSFFVFNSSFQTADGFLKGVV
jgi:hypothetical protein